jgi:hypothetical protein
MIQKILGVIAGYAIFAVTSLVLFKLSGQKPHADPSISFVIVTIIYGALFSLIAGIVAQIIPRANNLNVNYILAFIMAGFAAFSFFKSTGNHWTQLTAILVFAPVSILGGLLVLRRR